MIVDQKNASENLVAAVDSVTPESKHELQRQMQGYLGEDLAAVESRIRSLVSSRYGEVSRLTSRAASMGGKRLRPVLCILAARACCGANLSPKQLEDVLNVSSAVELVHAASLVHDDVMDRAELRRHQPTIYSISSNSEAILAGDFLFTRAYQAAASCRSTFAARELAKAATQLCEGELRQQACMGNWNLKIAEYLDILRQKTGVLCGVSCFLGAWAAGGTREQAVALGRFGTKLGVAFQIFDDWLDYWGTEEVGKTLGTDCLQEKPTLPTLRFLHSKSIPSENSLRRNAVPDHRLVDLLRENKRDFGRVRKLLDGSDASKYTLGCARRKIRSALLLLDEFQDSTAKDFLIQIARFSVMRTT